MHFKVKCCCYRTLPGSKGGFIFQATGGRGRGAITLQITHYTNPVLNSTGKIQSLINLTRPKIRTNFIIFNNSRSRQGSLPAAFNCEARYPLDKEGMVKFGIIENNQKIIRKMLAYYMKLYRSRNNHLQNHYNRKII